MSILLVAGFVFLIVLSLFAAGAFMIVQSSHGEDGWFVSPGTGRIIGIVLVATAGLTLCALLAGVLVLAFG